jgi:hypothetical protein
MREPLSIDEARDIVTRNVIVASEGIHVECPFVRRDIGRALSKTIFGAQCHLLPRDCRANDFQLVRTYMKDP